MRQIKNFKDVKSKRNINFINSWKQTLTQT